MKKLILVLLAALLLTSVSACSLYERSAKLDTTITESTKEGTAKNTTKQKTENMIYIKINNSILDVILEDNSSAVAFRELLKNGDITVKMSDYGNFEKVGALGAELPTNDESITTAAGDLILYQGNKITIYYDTNSWSFTRLGKIQNVSEAELKKILGNSDVTATFTIKR